MLKSKSMLITSEQITVTEQMMFEKGLSRFSITGQLGIPNSDSEKNPIEWKNFMEMEEEDFDKIESYFLNHE